MSDNQTNSTITGTSADMIGRMRAVIPATWFPVTSPNLSASVTPVLDGLLAGLAWGWSYCYVLMNFAVQQARIKTASGNFLDMICEDFFGVSVQRKSSETDEVFRNRIRANLLLPRATREALTGTIVSLINNSPNIFEPRNAADTGGYGSGSSSNAGGGGGYGTSAVALGSSNMPFQYLLTVPFEACRTVRESQASFIGPNETLQIAPRHVVRPLYSDGLPSGFLSEPRGFNLIKDSVGWTSWTRSSAEAIGRWVVDLEGVGAFWAGKPVLQIRVYSGGQVIGPSVTASTTGDAVTGSLWLLLPIDHSFQSLDLEVRDVTAPGNVVKGSADLALRGRWQRLMATTLAVASSGREISMTLVGVSTELMNLPVLTQCWQLEPGNLATSYIPSNQQIGIREADNLIPAPSGASIPVDPRNLNEAISRVIPAGSIAWTTIAG